MHFYADFINKIAITVIGASLAFCFQYLLSSKSLRSNKFDKLVDALSDLYFKVSMLQNDKFSDLLNEVHAFKKTNKDSDETKIFMSKKLNEYLRKLYELANYAGTVDNISRFYFDNLVFSQPIIDKYGEYGLKIIKLFELLSAYNANDADSVRIEIVEQNNLLTSLEEKIKSDIVKYREHLEKEHENYLHILYSIKRRHIRKCDAVRIQS